MILRVTEKCLTTNENDEEYYGLRCYDYETNKNNEKESILDLFQSFDTDNIIDSNDDFEGECLNSTIINIEIVEDN